MEIIGVLVQGDSGTDYLVRVRDGRATCGCKAYLFGGQVSCKHIAFALETLAEKV